MSSVTSDKFRELLFNTGINLLSDTIKIMLINTGYTPAVGDNFVDAITGGTSKELSGTGYTAGFGGSGRKTLSGKSVVRDNTNHVAYFTASNPTYSAINAGTVGAIGVVKEITSDALSPILGVIDVSPDIATNGGDYIITFDAVAGIFKLS